MDVLDIGVYGNATLWEPAGLSAMVGSNAELAAEDLSALKIVLAGLKSNLSELGHETRSWQGDFFVLKGLPAGEEAKARLSSIGSHLRHIPCDIFSQAVGAVITSETRPTLFVSGEKARELMRNILSAKPDDFLFSASLARLWPLDDLAEAARLYGIIADRWMNTGHPDKAREAYRIEAVSLFRLGIKEVKKGDKEKAAAHFSHAVAAIRLAKGEMVAAKMNRLARAVLGKVNHPTSFKQKVRRAVRWFLEHQQPAGRDAMDIAAYEALRQQKLADQNRQPPPPSQGRVISFRKK